MPFKDLPEGTMHYFCEYHNKTLNMGFKKPRRSILILCCCCHPSKDCKRRKADAR